jgi:aspartyl-tRNA(Asn)/glutamyl-tRNA(Gln) amidotransferase subunit C
MKVDVSLVDHLAHLSRLHIEPAEKEAIRQDMEKLIGFVEKLNELDTAGVEPLRHMSEVENVLREDMVVPSISQAEALASAPMNDGKFFKVPKVIRK